MERRLTQEEKAKIRELYGSRFAQYGRNHQTVGWGSAADQRLRFEMLCRNLDIRGKTVLDVGCGLGDLVKFLDAAYGTDYKYVGIDLSADLVAEAKKKFADDRCQFMVGDILEMPPMDDIDVVLLSGALNVRIGDNMGHAATMLRRMYESARVAVAANFLSSYVDYSEERNFHYLPGEMFAIAKSITKWVTMYHDYPLWEFTLQLQRQPVAKREHV